MKNAVAILVNFKAAQETVRCLRALEKGTVKPQCVYVVDNASTEESQKTFGNEAFELSVKWIWNTENRGFAAGCNQGIRAAQADGFDGFFWLLNNDTAPQEDALEKLLEKASETGAGITGSQITDMDGNFLGGVGFVNPQMANVRRANSPTEPGFDYVEGSSFLISPECLQKVGPMCEDYFLYFEENDYCCAAKKMGFGLAWATESIVRHSVGTSTKSELGKGKVPYFIDCLMIRNRVHFACKFGFPRVWVLLGLFISLGIRLKRLQPQRVWTILRITMSPNAFKNFVQKNGGYYA